MLEGESNAAAQKSELADGDVLDEAISKAGFGAEMVSTVTTWLGGLLREDQYARLDQIGHDGEGGIPLARVFIDLPVAGSYVFAENGRPAPSGFVQEALARGPRAVSLERRIPRMDLQSFGLDAGCPSSGFALIGGPGQGKTTVTQFLCQMHRAALLEHRAGELHQGARHVLRGMLDQCKDGGLALPTSGAIPWAVVLRDFAPWLERRERESSATLTEYLAEQVNRVLDDMENSSAPRMTGDHVRQLMRVWPSVLVLDGLDEVPDLEIREVVLASIRHLLQDLVDAEATSLIVATTRPQGYRDEFAGLRLEERRLEHLTTEVALGYADRLVRVRYHDRPDMRRKVMDRLRHATQEEATARLLRSPLQITLMATLVERIGRAPTERWSLFSDYYKIIYEREMERGGPLSGLLQKYRPYIDRIHTRVGLLLQVEGEAAEGSGPLMSRARLEEVVDTALGEEGIEQEERERLSRRILQATTDRIVLLVQARKDEYGFEIRSLQEFMAAGELTNATKGDAIVDARMMQIARASNFRNVFLFAASKAFTDMSRLRDVIVDQICPALNQAPDDEALRVLRVGSVLALEMLEEGSVLNQPKYARRLMEFACGLLERPPSHDHVRLAHVCEVGIEDILRKALEQRLALPDAWKRRAAWTTLWELISVDRSWAERLVESNPQPADEPLPPPLAFFSGCIHGVARRLADIDENDAGWIDVVDRAGRQIQSHTPCEHGDKSVPPAMWTLSVLIAAYQANPGRWGLLNVLASILLQQRILQQRIDPSNDDRSPLIDVPPIDIGSIDMPHLRDAAVAVTFARTNLAWTDIEPCVEPMVEATTTRYWNAFGALLILDGNPIDPAIKERLFFTWLQRVRNTRLAEPLDRALEQVARRKTNLDDPSTWDHLLLPLPRPKARRRSALPPPAASPQIETVHIENLRIFESLHLDIKPREDGLGQWMVLLGENGVGKTTLLRALVFALADDATVTALLQQSQARWCRHPAEKDVFATMVVKSRGARFLREIEQGAERDSLRTSSDPAPERPFVFAYGCRRGSALGGPDRSVAFTPMGAIATLFDEPAHLVHAETWLKGRALAATQDKHAKDLYKAILGALRKALGVDEIFLRNEQVWIKGNTLGEAPLAALSDGYLTTAGWMIDLLARWIERARQRDPERNISTNFLEEMTGIVLIDEIDLHLHPRWQCEVIRTTREMFKRMTFIVTTHNPLTLLGTEPGEVFVLRRSVNGKSRVKAALADLPKGVRADQILTGPWFGLESTLDAETLGLFKEHTRIVQQPSATTEARRKEIEGILRKRLGSFADTALERLALGVAAEIMSDENRELTPADREKLREEVLRLVKQRRGAQRKAT